MKWLWLLWMGSCTALIVVVLVFGHRSAAPVHEVVPAVALVSYSDPYGSSDPGGSTPPSTDPGLVAGSYPDGDGATQVGNGIDGLSVVPVVMAAGLLGLVPLWWAVRYVRRVLSA